MLPGMPPVPRLPEPEVIYEEVFCICNRPFQGFMVTCSACGELYVQLSCAASVRECVRACGRRRWMSVGTQGGKDVCEAIRACLRLV